MIKLPEGIESKYRFVTLAALRAEQLQSGARARLESTHRKAIVVAQEEVAEGLVEPWDGKYEDEEAAESEEAGEET
jgi:DNA-directed RNA polymerase omega subunit